MQFRESGIFLGSDQFYSFNNSLRYAIPCLNGQYLLISDYNGHFELLQSSEFAVCADRISSLKYNRQTLVSRKESKREKTQDEMNADIIA